LKPDIEAEITVLPSSVNLRKSAIRDDIVGYYECPIALPNGTWDCRVVFPDANGRVELGQTTTALIQFLSPNEALLGLCQGDTFQLMGRNEALPGFSTDGTSQLLGENGIIALGKVTKLLVAPITHELKLEFIGSSREYFRIWVVNLCLTLLTFGIFSAWAKVRKKRYFYSHTILDGTPFQYLGQPLPILRGRLIGASLFAVYYVSSHFFTSLLPYVFALGAVLAPWVIVRSASFKARYSAFRNMTFRFEGTYWGTLKVVSAWGLVPAIIIGMMFHWLKIAWIEGTLFAVGGLIYPWWISRLKNFTVCNTAFGNKNGQLSTTGGQFFKIYFCSGLLFALMLIPLGAALSIFHISKNSASYIILFSLPTYAAYALAYAYIQAYIGNLVWNETTLGPLRFKSTLSGWTMTNYYISNALAIIASAGLLTPWAIMRTMKYRAENLQVLVAGEVTEFSGSDRSNVSATGAELGEFFDMELSL